MEQELFNLSTEWGIFAALFVALFIYVMYDSRTREASYKETIKENQEIIKELSVHFGVVEEIKKDVYEINLKLDRRD